MNELQIGSKQKGTKRRSFNAPGLQTKSHAKIAQPRMDPNSPESGLGFIGVHSWLKGLRRALPATLVPLTDGASFSSLPSVQKAWLILFAVATFAGCAKHPTPTSSSAQVLRVSQRNEPADLDPATASLPDEFFIIRALSEGLVIPAPENGPPQPAAAESWEISPDGLTYTFHLRPRAKWSNGEAVTADDFISSYRRVLTPATASPKAPLLFMVENARAFASGGITDFSAVGFRAVDPLTLVVTLEYPMPQFLRYAASGPWIPVNPRTVAQFGRNWTLPEHFVGNGAFVLTEWRPHQRIVVRKNPAFHGEGHVLLDEIQFIAFDNGDAEERAFRAGQLDVTMAIPQSKLGTYRQSRAGEAHHAPLAETRYLAFNTSRPPLDDIRVRRALALAINRSSIVDKVLHGGQEAAFRFVPPPLRGIDDAVVRIESTLSESTATARQLLAEAGFPEGRGFPVLELSTWPISAPVTEVLQEMWTKELGINVKLLTREAKVHIAALRDGNYDIAFMTAIPDVADAGNLLEDFVSNSPGNYPHWSDPHFDALVAQARRNPDPIQATGELREAEARLLEQCPLTPLYFNSTNWLMASNVRGWHQDAFWTRFYQDVFLDDKN
ncbi:MAG: extracellular solute-binding protein family 5 [Verrucomicrobia bacterium]|nr:extracellular solute-binding protein family 5 [Verrucomicrobiota bacterium]